MEYTQLSLKQIFEQDRTKQLVLPDFQRDFVWTREKQRGLLASLLVGLPIGNILIIKGSKDDFPARQLVLTTGAQPPQECSFLLDGQQRLSCLKSIFDDLYPDPGNWRSSWDHIYGLLRNRWFLKMIPSTDEPDIWGWRSLRYLPDKYDPDQVEDFIVCHKILVKDESNSNAYFHPAFKVFDRDGREVTGESQRRLRLAIKYAQEGLVPMFNVFQYNGQPSSIHATTLSKIAYARMEQVKADVSDGKLNLKDILGYINPDVETISETIELDKLWNQLASSWATQIQTAIDKLVEQKIPTIILPADEIGRAASIFEAINEGGTPLTNFDLIVAKMASLRPSLSQQIKGKITQEITSSSALISSQVPWKFENMSAIKDNSISKFVTDQFLNLLSIYIHERAGGQLDIDKIKVDHIKQGSILKLEPHQISSCYDLVFSSLVKAFAFLQFRCGVLSVNDIIYRLMILPIANLFACKADCWENTSELDKIEYWYWLSLFSGRYKDNQNERCIEDIKLLYKWLKRVAENPSLNFVVENPFIKFFNGVLNSHEYSDESTLLMKGDDAPPSAIKNMINQYILSRQPKDFILTNTGTSITLKAWQIVANSTDIEEHHIIPLASATLTSIEQSTKEIRKDKRHILNSPLNLTLISKGANQAIKSIAPSTYLNQLSPATLGDHLVSQSMIDKIREDQSQNDYYKNILHERFNTLKQEVKTELERLLES